ncbi:hypothetical protein [Algoriphagus sp. Y33]|uniref:hypothetical protein n=1 Tax=Algoriphagus sp. Y33 TaxID=2772483 RepID=UPI00177F0C50|nr:hypothetical protein [Algoriphagus sp. Y33]
MKRQEIAIEELKLLQTIISRHDDISFKIKGWCITLNIGIITAIYGMPDFTFLNSKALALFLLPLANVFFIWVGAIYRVAMNRAIERSTKIEKEIRNNRLKKYPQLNITLGRRNRLKDQLNSLKNIRTTAPYIIIFIIDILAIFIKYI